MATDKAHELVVEVLESINLEGEAFGAALAHGRARVQSWVDDSRLTDREIRNRIRVELGSIEWTREDLVARARLEFELERGESLIPEEVVIDGCRLALNTSAQSEIRTLVRNAVETQIESGIWPESFHAARERLAWLVRSEALRIRRLASFEVLQGKAARSWQEEV